MSPPPSEPQVHGGCLFAAWTTGGFQTSLSPSYFEETPADCLACAARARRALNQIAHMYPNSAAEGCFGGLKKLNKDLVSWQHGTCALTKTCLCGQAWWKSEDTRVSDTPKTCSAEKQRSWPKPRVVSFDVYSGFLGSDCFG